MIKVSEIKTPNCTRCKAIEPEYIALKNKFIAEYPNDINFYEYVLNVNDEAKEYMTKYGLKAAPSFVVEVDSTEGKVVKFDELEETLQNLF